MDECEENLLEKDLAHVLSNPSEMNFYEFISKMDLPRFSRYLSDTKDPEETFVRSLVLDYCRSLKINTYDLIHTYPYGNVVALGDCIFSEMNDKHLILAVPDLYNPDIQYIYAKMNDDWEKHNG